jgi:hypothetical protein
LDTHLTDPTATKAPNTLASIQKQKMKAHSNAQNLRQAELENNKPFRKRAAATILRTRRPFVCLRTVPWLERQTSSRSAASVAARETERMDKQFGNVQGFTGRPSPACQDITRQHNKHDSPLQQPKGGALCHSRVRCGFRFSIGEHQTASSEPAERVQHRSTAWLTSGAHQPCVRARNCR